MMNPMRGRRLRGGAREPPSAPTSIEDTKPFATQLLESGGINEQSDSPLFGTIPQEIRDLIFEYALASYPDPDRPYRSNERFARPGASGHPRIATELLRTCKAVYVETYLLPITLNPVIEHYDYSDPVLPRAGSAIRKLQLSWQLAALHMVDISLQQTHLEGNVLSQAATRHQARLRYDRSRAGATLHTDDTPTNSSQDRTQSTGPNTLGASTPSFPEQPQLQRLSGLEMPSTNPNVPRIIDRLTLRLGRTEWWTWEDPPTSMDSSQLALDPGSGTGSDHQRCTFSRMSEQAAKRRQGTWKGWGHPRCWGAQVALFKGLKELECIFETFAQKVGQLDAVIECAKTWTFPMEDGYELHWDGMVEKGTWRGVDGYGYEEKNTWLTVRDPDTILGTEEERSRYIEANPLPDHRLFEVRTIRFTRRHCDA